MAALRGSFDDLVAFENVHKQLSYREKRSPKMDAMIIAELTMSFRSLKTAFDHFGIDTTNHAEYLNLVYKQLHGRSGIVAFEKLLSGVVTLISALWRTIDTKTRSNQELSVEVDFLRERCVIQKKCLTEIKEELNDINDEEAGEAAVENTVKEILSRYNF